MQNKKFIYALIVVLPLVVSAFTHLWNPIGFPEIYIDEDHYLRRSIQVLDGNGPQESILVYDHPYDHPYFGQIFLAFMLKMANYNYVSTSPTETPESIQNYYMDPRIIMGILAIIDTFLVFKIGEIWHSKKLGFTAAILFAIMPLSWILKMILLDSLLLPFLLTSIFLALYAKRKTGSSQLSFVMISGIALGLAIFTKVPIITFIPLIGYLIFDNTRRWRFIGLWLIPVFLIPMIWPAYVIYSGHLEDGLVGILYQVDRGERNFSDTISFIFNADPVLIALGLAGGIAITVLKRDPIFFLWVIPYILFIYQIGGIIKYFHFIELFPIMALAAAFIIVKIVDSIALISRKYEKINVPNSIYIVVFGGICLFGLIITLMFFNINTNETFFEISAFISNQVTNNTSPDEKPAIMGQHWIRSFSWIPMYIHDREHYIKDVFPERYLKEPLKTNDILMIVDNQLKRSIFDYSNKGPHLDEIRKIYHDSDRIGLFLDNPISSYDTDRYPFTNLKETNGLDLIEIRSNYDYNHKNEPIMAYASTIDNSGVKKAMNLTLPQPKMPKLYNPNLKVELVTSGLKYPTTMAFVGKDDLLIVEKNNGQVKRLVNGTLLDKPLLDLNVANKMERGLLGIAVANQTSEIENITKTFVYFYYTQSTEDGNDECSGATECNVDTNPLGNRIYKYEWTGDNLINKTLILDLPVGPGADHNGGAIKVGPDGNVYALIGDGDSCWEDFCCLDPPPCPGAFTNSSVNSESSNVPTGSSPDGRGGILRITPQGEPVLGGENKTTGILADYSPLSKYFAYGIRNGFGLAFDPLTGKLWDTENGPGYGDEINLVDPGFNSGWLRVMGWWPVIDSSPLPAQRGVINSSITTIPNNLETFDDKGRYSNPEFAWNMSVGVTAIDFLKGDRLGKQYQNDLFTADFNNDYLYNFDLSEDRTKLDLSGPLSDKIANNNDELEEKVLGQGFGIITDIKEGPDGYLYLLSHMYGNVYRIVPTTGGG